MGIVIPFARIERATSTNVPPATTAAGNDERAIADAALGAAGQLRLLAVAGPLLDRCRDRYGFVVMREGLPEAAETLARALLELSRGLALLDTEMGAPRTYPTFGVYFGRRQLAWFEDGYSGSTGLAVPNDIEAADLAAFVRPRVCAKRSRSQE